MGPAECDKSRHPACESPQLHCGYGGSPSFDDASGRVIRDRISLKHKVPPGTIGGTIGGSEEGMAMEGGIRGGRPETEELQIREG